MVAGISKRFAESACFLLKKDSIYPMQVIGRVSCACELLRKAEECTQRARITV
jgi:hypothetical protein